MKVLVDKIPDPPEGCVVLWDYPEFGDYYCCEDTWMRWAIQKQTQIRYLVARPIRYREPSLPADVGKLAEFSDDEKRWDKHVLGGYAKLAGMINRFWLTETAINYKHCRIEVSE